MGGSFCPITKMPCREDCVFHTKTKISTLHGFTSCLIVSKVDALNDEQHDDLVALAQAIELKD